jgi:hypothetical protein
MKKTIKINLRQDRETGLYYADVITDVSLTTVKHAFDSLTSSYDGRIIKEKVSHTKGYIFRKRIKTAVTKTAYFFKAILKGVKSGYEDDFKKQQFTDEVS